MTNIQILKKHFGFDNFKDIQEEVIDNLLAGNNSLCLMPTGGGKSIIYQVAGLQTGKTTIVIAHRISTLKYMDRIVVLEDGKIIEDGVPELLLNNIDGRFYNLWKIQSSGGQNSFKNHNEI
jgi:hypothetical protein